MDGKKIGEMFPALKGRMGCYLDNAATTQKPACVLQTVMEYYRDANANVHRAGYRIAQESTRRYEMARERAALFINCRVDEVIFTGGTTMAVNMVAYSYALGKLDSGKNIVVTAAEHNSNLLPWSEICKKKGAQLRIIPFRKDGEMDLEEAERMISRDTVLTAFCLDSNVLDMRIPAGELTELAHRKGCPVFADAAQTAAHHRIDCAALQVDFLAFSGHKTYGPMGSGILYASRNMQENMEVFLTGGGTIEERDGEMVWLSGPAKWEAGTPDVAGVVGLERAFEFLEELGWDRIQACEEELKAYAYERLGRHKQLYWLGNRSGSAPILSFWADGIHSYDLAAFLGIKDICVRSGKHCAHELMRRIGIDGCVRVSLGIYNTREDIDMLDERLEWALKKIKAEIPLNSRL